MKIHGVAQVDKYWDKEKGSSEHARKLVDACPYGALRYVEEKDSLIRNYHDCHQCLTCLEIDQEIGALKLPRESFTAFQEMMAISTSKVLETFSPEKIFYLNFLTQITTYCDCMGIGQPPVVNDIGILGSKDIIAIETATLDLINKEGLIERNIPPFLKNVNLNYAEDIHLFTRLHGPYKDPYEVVRILEKMGFGTSQYELIEVLSPDETAKMELPEKSFEGEPSFF
jgi:uncharacterized Fe-S center protein